MESSLDLNALQADLLDLFERHGVSVGVGLTRDGVAIRSQDPRVDAQSIGVLTAFDGDTATDDLPTTG